MQCNFFVSGRPAVQLPGSSKAIVAVRFCPIIFTLRGSNSGKTIFLSVIFFSCYFLCDMEINWAMVLSNECPATFFKLPYRIIFAVATLNSLYIYDTESVAPIALFAGLHYAAITDIAW